jgi:hypothetical protein
MLNTLTYCWARDNCRPDRRRVERKEGECRRNHEENMEAEVFGSSRGLLGELRLDDDIEDEAAD